MDVIEDKRCCLKTDIVLEKIQAVLILVPLEAHNRLLTGEFHVNANQVTLSIHVYVHSTLYLKNSPMSGAVAAAPGKSVTPRPSIISRRVLSCW